MGQYDKLIAQKFYLAQKLSGAWHHIFRCIRNFVAVHDFLFHEDIDVVDKAGIQYWSHNYRPKQSHYFSYKNEYHISLSVYLYLTNRK